MAHILDAVIQLKDNFSSTLQQVEKNIGGFSRTAGKMGRDVQKVGRSLENTGGKLTKTLTLPVIGAGIAAGKAAIDFESAFAGVRKTVDATEADFKRLEQGIRDMAKEIPATAVEIAGVAEAAGQLGIQTDKILGFTRVMIDLGEATNMSSEEAATAFARFANITGMSQDNFDRLGSVVVDLGNNLATTESEIVNMAMRLAGAGSQIGLSEAQIMSFAGALSSVGIEVEAGGSAFSKLMINMQLATETGGEGLKDFAKVAGMTASEFSDVFKNDATAGITAFVKGLSKSEEQGISAIKVLDDMGITEVRLRDTLLRAAGASDVFSDSLDIGSKAWEENTALAKEAEERYKTTASLIKIAKNNLIDMGITIGEVVMPYVVTFTEKLKGLSDWYSKLSPKTQESIVKFALMAAAIGPIIFVIGKLTTGVGGAMRTFGKFAGVVKKLGLLKAIFSPGVIVVGVILALVAAGYLLYKNWDKIKAKVNEVFPNLKEQISTTMDHVKNIFDTTVKFLSVVLLPVQLAFRIAWETIKNIFFVALEFIGTILGAGLQIISGIVDVFAGLLTGNWERMFGGIYEIVTGVIDGIVGVFKGGINLIIGLMNGFIGGINKVKMPKWIPGIGGKGITIPLIPQLAKGTPNWGGGIVQVHEQGGEIIDLPNRSRVYPHDESVSMAREQGRKESKNSSSVLVTGNTFHVRKESDIDSIATALFRKIEKASLNMA